ncbi:hypothetical protein NE237_025719 [Protea cynaroides]|uniref:Neprosin PEP catalytic domain-containing protein n=1 Tax=Protea cynaroides TaxID=273540 RepID=A0A9Q0K212_9MAGN|nr:hypothetical protein NE237_025719 [Protea cynaroides]
MGKVHGSLARAGKVRGQTPKVAKQDKKKKPRGRAHKRMQYNRRFVTTVVGFGKKRGPNSSENNEGRMLLCLEMEIRVRQGYCLSPISVPESQVECLKSGDERWVVAYDFPVMGELSYFFSAAFSPFSEKTFLLLLSILHAGGHRGLKLSEGITLVLASPLILFAYKLVSESLGIQLLIFISFSGLKFRDIELASRAVLPRFYAGDIRSESWNVFNKCKRKVVVTANPIVMVEPFVRDFMGGDKMKPSYDPITDKTMKEEESSMTVISQLWHRSGNCPVGTIPIRRIHEHLLKANSLQKYGRKNPYVVQAPKKTENKEIKHINHIPYLDKTRTSYDPQLINRSDALLITQGYNYIGAKGDLNVWNPNVESEDEYSAAQIWLKNGPSYSFESIESGWMVDSSNETGCFDLICSGFVQTNHEIALGASIDPISGDSGPQYQISIYIYMDTNTSNWWLQYGDKINIGYWPAEILGLLRHSATYVEWGGEVYSSKIGIPPHTATAMGSGDFASSLFGSASYIKHIRILDYSLSLKYPLWVSAYTDEENCYTAVFYQEGYIMEPEFYFGGPGQNPRCP